MFHFQKIKLACDVYRAAVGVYPKAETAADLLKVLSMPMAEGKPPALRLEEGVLEAARDEWGRALVFRQRADGDWVLESAGPDGVPGNEDDLVQVLWRLEPELSVTLARPSEEPATGAHSGNDRSAERALGTENRATRRGRSSSAR